MKVLLVLTYYRPYISGLTDYAVRLAEVLAARGHKVTVLTSRHAPNLPAREMLDGVEVVRVRPVLRISKGLLMPTMPFHARRLLREADVVNLHSPQLDSAWLTWMARWLRKPVVLTYQCDLNLPRGLINGLAGQAAFLADRIAADGARRIVTLSLDYARHSRLLQSRLAKVSEVLPPPAELPLATVTELQAFRARWDLPPEAVLIGMNARLAAEKGAEYLAMALKKVLGVHPQAMVVYVGQYQNVLGEEAYARRIQPLISELSYHWRFLGLLEPGERAAFFQSCAVTVLPSLNATEAFGMVQVESMLCGTPVVVSDLPGVRVPVQLTGMGKVVPPGDADALAAGILEILATPQAYQRPREAILPLFSRETFATAYEGIFQEALAG